jgi:hypothetical protein
MYHSYIYLHQTLDLCISKDKKKNATVHKRLHIHFKAYIFIHIHRYTNVYANVQT